MRPPQEQLSESCGQRLAPFFYEGSSGTSSTKPKSYTQFVLRWLVLMALSVKILCDDVQIDYNIGIQSYYTKYKLDIELVKNITELECDDLVYHETAQEQRSMALSHGAPLTSQYLDIPDCYEDIVGGATVGLLCGSSFYLFDINTWKQIGTIELTGKHKGTFVSSAQNGYTTILVSASDDNKVWSLSFVNSFDSIFSKTNISDVISNPESLITVKYISIDKENSTQPQLQIIIYESPLVGPNANTVALGSDQVFVMDADSTGVPIPTSIGRFPIMDFDRAIRGEKISITEILVWNNARYAFHRYFIDNSTEPTDLRVQVCPPGSECTTGAPSRRIFLNFSSDSQFYHIDLASLTVYHIMDAWVLFIGTRMQEITPILFMCTLKPETYDISNTGPVELQCSTIVDVALPYGMSRYIVERPSFTDRQDDEIRMFIEAKNDEDRQTITSSLYKFSIKSKIFLPPKEWIIQSFVQWPHYEDDEWVLTAIRQKSVETFSSEINFIEIDFRRYFAEVPSKLCVNFRRRLNQRVQRIPQRHLP